MSRRGIGSRASRRYPGGAAPEFRPTSFTGCKLWLRADLGVTITGSGASTWADQSGIGDTGRDHLQGTDAARPTLNAADSAYNNRSTLSFNGSQDMASGAWSVAPPSNDATLIVVGNADNTATTQIFFSDNAAWEVSLFQATTNICSWYESAQINATPFDMSTKKAMVVEMNGASSKIYISSTTAAVTGDQGAAVAAATSLGGQAGVRRLTGKIAEVILYTPRLAAADLATVLTYLGTRYSITIS